MKYTGYITIFLYGLIILLFVYLSLELAEYKGKYRLEKLRYELIMNQRELDSLRAVNYVYSYKIKYLEGVRNEKYKREHN